MFLWMGEGERMKIGMERGREKGEKGREGENGKETRKRFKGEGGFEKGSEEGRGETEG